MKFSLALFAAASAEMAQEYYERRLVINTHFEVCTAFLESINSYLVQRLRDATLDLAHNKKDIKFYNKFQAWFTKIDEARNEDGTRCGEEVDDADDAQVFSADDYCKLSSQLNSAMSSFARQWACQEAQEPIRSTTLRITLQLSARPAYAVQKPVTV